MSERGHRTSGQRGRKRRKHAVKEIDLDSNEESGVQEESGGREERKGHRSVREVNVSMGSRKARSKNVGPCLNCTSPESPYRFVTKEYLCRDCRQAHPFKLITRSTCYNLYGLNFTTLNEAYKDGLIRMITAPNFYNKNAPPVHLYYEHEIHELVVENEHRKQGE